MKIICKYISGSRSFGLETPESDTDESYIFLHDDPKYIIGLERFEHQNSIIKGVDSKGRDFRHAISMLRNSNSEIIEHLFNKNWTVITPEWQAAVDNKYKLIDSEKLFKCIMGYSHGEEAAAFAEVTGKLGEKRRKDLEKYKFSPKNVTQCLRLLWACSTFYLTSQFPVHIGQYNEEKRNWLYEIKTSPTKFTIEYLKEEIQKHRGELKVNFDNRREDYKFNEDFANNLICKTYYNALAIHYRYN